MLRLDDADRRAAEFDMHRGVLFSIAYRMLGTRADAEDVVQEAYLRWQQADVASVESPRAFLTTVVTRLCIDQLRSARVRREEYVGPWLPEPILTDPAPPPDQTAALADSLSMAFLVMLESLSPVERAAFLLREVFDYEYSEIAAALDKSEAACRQIVKRARESVAERRPRFAPSPEHRDRLTQEFVSACATGDMNALLATLSSDITLFSDGGGKTRAALNPIHGPDRVARFLLGLLAKRPASYRTRPAVINGEPGVISYIDGRLFSTLTLHVGPSGIEGIFIVLNPEKLARIDASTS
jgi:RNA polymerase sigma-70 factor, ECF subfamily